MFNYISRPFNYIIPPPPRENECPNCFGLGVDIVVVKKRKWWFNKTKLVKCSLCNGSGIYIEKPSDDKDPKI